jgi:hypothetical protein
MVVIVSAIVSIGGGLILVPSLGVLGAAIVISVIDLAGWLVSLPFYKHTIGSLQLRIWILPFLGGSTIVGCSLLLQYLHVSLWVRGPLAALAYLPFSAGFIKSQFI